MLALVLCVSLAACGGGSKGPGKEQLENLTNAYNQVATLYNEVATNAQANGWMDDEETSAALQTISATLDPIGQALSGNISDLEGADFDQLPGAILEYLPELEALEQKVSAPYVNVVIPEEVAESYNELAELYQQAYELMEANGWMEDEGALFWLQSAGDLLDEIEAGLPDDVDMDFLQRRLRGGMANTRDLIMMVTIPYDVANDGGVG